MNIRTNRRLQGMALALTSAAVGGALAIQPALSAHKEDGKAFLVRTNLVVDHDIGAPAGTVRKGSFLGNSAFCRGGEFRDKVIEDPEFAIVKRFRCDDGRLRIRFQPAGTRRTQSGPWKIVGGRGKYEDLEGHGWMAVRFESRQMLKGTETFTGTVK